MRLKSIEILGFKSFPDKTRLTFDRAVTAVIGPNGSGKSNISDAIRWVLGEQSNKNLRGKSKEDVIFQGTALRKAQGFAEVTITFDNKDKRLASESEEVSVTRRYFRSGESEYRINGATVRLKDVHELFMDTGLGRDGYSMIGQGKIDEIVGSKSDERRDIFEEAAGISKYRYRRIEAERKLDRANDNLLRLKDIMNELEGRVGPLKEQSEKAVKFLEFSQEKKQLEVGLWLKTLERSNELLREQDYKITLAKSQYEQIEKELTAIVVASEEGSLNSQKIAAQMDAIRREKLAKEERTASLKGEIAVLENTIFHNNETIARLRQDIDSASSDDESINLEIKLKKENIEKLKLVCKEKQEQLDSLLDTLTSLTSNSGEFSSQIEQKNAKLNNLSALISENKVKILSANVSVEELNESLTRIDFEMGALQDTLDEAVKEIALIKEDFELINKNLAECENIVSGHQLKLDSRIKKSEETKAEIDKINLDYFEIERRIKILLEMERNMEGYNFAVKTIAKEAARNTLREIHGAVSRLVQVDSKFATAVETALGAAAQNIVVSNEDDAKRAITYLKNNNGGRATFLPITAIKSRPFQEKGVEDCVGYVGIASELVKFDNQYENVINSLLGRTVVAEDMDSAVAMSRKYSYRFKVVTLDGQVVNAGGSLTGGSGIKNSGLLNRSTQIDSLRKKGDGLKQKQEEMQGKYSAQLSEIAQMKAVFLAAQEELKTANEDKIRLLGELKFKEEQQKGATLQLQNLSSQKASNQNKVKEYEEAILKADHELENAKVSKELIESELASLSGDQSSLSENRERLTEQVSSLRLEIIAINKDVENFESLIVQLESNKDNHESRIASRLAEIESLKVENEKNALNVEELKATNDGLIANSTSDDRELERLNNERIAIEQASITSRNLEREKASDKEKLGGELARLTERKEVMENEYSQIISKLYEEYELTIAQANEIGFEIEDEKEASKRLNEIKRGIKSLGSVNVGAIEEYKEVSSRYEYMKKQIDDIESSAKELRKLIGDLTSKMKDMFVEKFEQIGKNFTGVFSHLFGGGTAKLELSDPSNVLESGIEIYAQPPGKNISIIEQLSGGEKALIALSIYFAIMQVNAPPFCLLDEVESALDEVNVDKVAQYLRKLSVNTQFISITHRRGTMEEADVLYGVTMQEKGVSKLLSIDVTEIEKTLETKSVK